ncbi:MAG: RNA polymerase sigma factor [Proteobacteria bacterium]|nr:RNA polymerase sigma factor [Pseudomonadota bacterium]
MSILQRVATGDEAAVQECIDRYSGLVWSLARRLSPTPADAEDAVQEIFVALWKSADRYNPEIASETTFIATVARRRLIDRHRAEERRPPTAPLDDSPPLPASASDATMDAALDVSRVAKALESLAPEQRHVIELSVAGGHSHQQIATATGLALGTVKTHIRRGLLKVRELLAQGGAGEGTP